MNISCFTFEINMIVLAQIGVLDSVTTDEVHES